MHDEGQAQSDHHKRGPTEGQCLPQRARPLLSALRLKFTSQNGSSGRVSGCGFGTAKPPVRSFGFGVKPLQGELAKPRAQPPPSPKAKAQIGAQPQPEPQPQVEP